MNTGVQPMARAGGLVPAAAPGAGEEPASAIPARPGDTGDMTGDMTRAARRAAAVPIAPRRIPAAATGQDAGATTAMPPGMATGAAKEE